MGTETKINCYTENTATGINRVPNIVKLSSATTFNNCVNNGKCSSTNIVTSVSNSTSAQPLPSSSQIAAGTSVPFVPIHIDENAVIEGAKEILKVIRPTWDLNFVQFKMFCRKVQIRNVTGRSQLMITMTRNLAMLLRRTDPESAHVTHNTNMTTTNEAPPTKKRSTR
ncbi:Ethanolamine kinase [Lucilia cuprina]|nr:Ethanolamine kinase [Lucilia cuprina]